MLPKCQVEKRQASRSLFTIAILCVRVRAGGDVGWMASGPRGELLGHRIAIFRRGLRRVQRDFGTLYYNIMSL